MRRYCLAILAGLAFGPLTAPIAHAQDYPSRQIALIAPWPAGGAVDALCRAVAPHLEGDRYLALDIEAVTPLVRRGDFRRLVSGLDLAG